MPRILYDVAVITDYTRGKTSPKEQCQQNNHNQHQLSSNDTNDGKTKETGCDLQASIDWLNEHSRPQPFPGAIEVEKTEDNFLFGITDSFLGNTNADACAERVNSVLGISDGNSFYQAGSRVSDGNSFHEGGSGIPDGNFLHETGSRIPDWKSLYQPGQSGDFRGTTTDNFLFEPASNVTSIMDEKASTLLYETSYPSHFGNSINEVAGFESANSVSGYSSVGTLSSMSGFSSTSVGSVDLVENLIQWTNNCEGNDTETSMPTTTSSAGESSSNYETCSENPQSAVPEITPFQAELTDSPSELPKRSKKKKLKKDILWGFNPMSEYSPLEDDGTNEPNFLDAEVVKPMENPHGRLDTILECSLTDRSMEWVEDEEEEERLEAGLNRVAEQLFELNAQIVTPGNEEGFECERAVVEDGRMDIDDFDITGNNNGYDKDNLIGKIDSTKDFHSFQSESNGGLNTPEVINAPFQIHYQTNTAVNEDDASRDDMWFTADSEQQSSDDGHCNKSSSFQISSTNIDHANTNVTACDEDSKDKRNDMHKEPNISIISNKTDQNNPPALSAVKDDAVHTETILTECHDIGVEECDVTIRSPKEVSHSSARHPSFDKSSSAVRFTEVLGANVNLSTTVNDSGMGTSINTTASKTPFKQMDKVQTSPEIGNNADASLGNDKQTIYVTFDTLSSDKHWPTLASLNSTNHKTNPVDTINSMSDITDEANNEIPYKKFMIPNNMEEKRTPYHCNVSHSRDFMDISEFISSGLLPHEHLTERNVFSILSISQRIVRIKVTKPYQPSDPYFDKNTNETSLLSNCVMKSSLTMDADVPQDTDHYGTGFAFYVSADHIEVRTHSRLVGSPSDAAKTEVRFNLLDTDNDQWLTVDCKGQSDRFQTNVHSHTSIISCPTTHALRSHLHLFQSIPIDIQSSLFNDSSYFTDSSPEPSFSTKEQNSESRSPVGEIQKDSVEDIGFNEKDTNSLSLSLDESFESEEEESEDIHLNRETFGDHDKNMVPSKDNDISSDNRPRIAMVDASRESIDLGYSENIENPFDYCGVKEFVVREAFESVIGTEADRGTVAVASTEIMLSPENDSNDDVFEVVKGHNSLYTNGNVNLVVDSPISQSIVFRPAVTSVISTSVTGVNHPGSAYECDYPGTLGYQPFNSYAADVMEECKPIPDNCLNCSILDLPLEKWEFESLLFAQNQHRDEYNQTFVNKNRKINTGNAVSQCSDTSIVYADNPTFNSEYRRKVRQNLNAKFEIDCQGGGGVGFDEDLWDVDLLGIDVNSLCIPKGGDIQLERLVEDILSEDASVFNSLSDDIAPLSTTGVQKRPQVAFIMAYPHGGMKRVSCGRLNAVPTSSSSPADGELYDIPTCFGCCGAPVLSLNQNGDVFVTTIVHNGTTELRDRRLFKGFGLSYFPQSALEFSQCFSV